MVPATGQQDGGNPGDDLAWQNEFQTKLKKFLEKECKKKQYQAIVAVEQNNGRGFFTSVGSLKEETAFRTWKVLVSGLGIAVSGLVQNFNLGGKIEEPVIQPKKLEGDKK